MDGLRVVSEVSESRAQGTRENVALRRTFTVAIKSFNAGPSSNQMEDANTKGAVKSPVVSPRDVQPDRGRVGNSGSFPRSVSNAIPAFVLATDW